MKVPYGAPNSVADPGSGAFFYPWIIFLESLEAIFRVKILQFFDADPDPGSVIFFEPGSGMEKIGSVTLVPNICMVPVPPYYQRCGTGTVGTVTF
jgi:hypothetical protein